ncbi:MAG: MBL fold metallo-hydrolase [Bacillota bacterium]
MGTKQISIVPLGMTKAFIIKGIKNILVDTGMPGSFDRIMDAMKLSGIEPPEISLIVITHNHLDHVGELYRLKQFTGAEVLIHKSEAEALEKGISTDVKPTGFFGKLLLRLVKDQKITGVKADILLEEEMSLKEYGIDGKIIHTPGHTPGSISVILDSGEMIVGDLLSGNRISKGKKADKPVFAVDLAALKATLLKLADLSPKVVYNTHGVPCNGDALKSLAVRL